MGVYTKTTVYMIDMVIRLLRDNSISYIQPGHTMSLVISFYTQAPAAIALSSFSPLKCHYGGLIFHFKTYTHKVILLVIYPVMSMWLSMKWP